MQPLRAQRDHRGCSCTAPPFTEISDSDYLQKIDTGTRPVIVVLYADKDEKSRLLATLGRYLATDFSGKITFYAYPVSKGAQVNKNTQRLQKSSPHHRKAYAAERLAYGFAVGAPPSGRGFIR